MIYRDSTEVSAARRTIGARWIVVAIGVVLLMILLFQPAVANQFGYAVPLSRGLPCRIYYAGGTYDDNLQCGGAEMTAWMRWMAARHRPAGHDGCLSTASIRPPDGKRPRQVASVPTLLGLGGHAVMTGKGSYTPRSAPPITLYVQDGTCYRAYNREIFP